MFSDGAVSLYLSVIEFILCAFTMTQRKKHPAVIFAALMLFFLAGYQLCEALMCRFGFTGHMTPYLAIVDISLLPPLTLLFSLRFQGSRSSVPYVLFIPILFFSVFYGFHFEEMLVVQCTPFYAMYHYPLGDLYGFFYYAPILTSMILFGRRIKKEENPRLRALAIIMLSGFVFISIPVLTAFASKAAGNATMLKAVESIMCKSAIVLAAAVTYVSFRLPEEPVD